MSNLVGDGSLPSNFSFYLDISRWGKRFCCENARRPYLENNA